MKIVKIWGGVGNQLFQYALYRMLKIKESEIYVDLSWFDNPDRKYYYPNQLLKLNLKMQQLDSKNKYYHSEKELELLRLVSAKKILKILYPIYYLKRVHKEKMKCINEAPLYIYNEMIMAKNDFYLVGYWQNKKYFIDVIDNIIRDIQFDKDIYNGIGEIAEKIKKENSVSVHIRRNDYGFEDFDNICSKQYYLNSIRYIRDNINKPVFYIFSNNISLAKEMLGTKEDFVYVEENDREHGLGDLLLMSLCKHNIIANSTFGWWGAVLNSNIDKMVIYPKQWTNKEVNLNIMFEEWIGI